MFEYVIAGFCWYYCPEFIVVVSLPAGKKAQLNHIPPFFVRLTGENYTNS